ncbi:molybdenum cofactor guanylyltransferase [Pseudonocardia sp. MH-G8]|nr:molybdenum cofactor guanylyltransferase [Pseudonocardia sp. MH-G8]
MGQPKAALEWHGSTLLRRTTGLLARAVEGPVVVVRAPGQPLPPLPDGVAVVDDPVEGLGPVQGIATGLAAVADRAEAAFVCSTDMPFLHPAYARRVLRLLDADTDAVLPHARGHRQPLAAVYRTALAPVLAQMAADRQLKLGQLFERCRTRRTDDAELLADARLRGLDPQLESVVNINEPEDYRAARERPAPSITVQRYGALAARGHHGPVTVSAATLGAAAAAVELPLDRHVVAALNGDQITRDPETPLVAGDSIAFLSADAGG